MKEFDDKHIFAKNICLSHPSLNTTTTKFLYFSVFPKKKRKDL